MEYPQKIIQQDEFSSLVDLFNKTCERFDEKPAFVNFGVEVSFNKLKFYSESLSSYLLNDLNLTKGDRVSIMMPNILQYPIAFIGCLKAGAIVVNTNPLYTTREMKHQFNDAGVKAVVILENFCANLQEIIEETGVAYVFHTSIGSMLGTVKGKIVDFVLRYVKKMVPKWEIDHAQTFHYALK